MPHLDALHFETNRRPHPADLDPRRRRGKGWPASSPMLCLVRHYGCGPRLNASRVDARLRIGWYLECLLVYGHFQCLPHLHDQVVDVEGLLDARRRAPRDTVLYEHDVAH